MDWLILERNGVFGHPYFQLLTADEPSNFHVLCEDCQYSIQYIGRQCLYGNFTTEHVKHHTKPEDFHKAALQGCAICRALWRKLSVSQQARLLSLNCSSDYPHLTSMGMTPLPFEANVDKFRKSEPETAAIWVYFPETSGNDLSFDFCDLDGLDHTIHSTSASFVLYPTTTMEAHHEQLPAESSTWCAQSTNLALGWIQECTKHHSRCALLTESLQWYPTRLIEVGGRGKLPCLIVSSEHSLTGPYLTLSHCWGRAFILQLTAYTLPSFKDRDALRDLPKTFEHALMVARELQVKYIWIDSLCIIQDDPKDWLHESALMHKIYSNAICNIAATGARDSSEGLFFERDPGHVKPVRTRVLHGVTAVEFKGLYDISEVDFWKDAVLEAPLNRRGWVCQERLLAPRILHFGKNQLLWECCVMEAAEKYPHGLPAAMLHNNPNIGLKRRFVDSWINSGQTNQLASPTTVSGVKVWNDIISAFSSAFLTKPTDKIVALSGIAKRMKELLHDEYVAGLWRNNLVPQLLWKVKDCKQSDGSPSNRPSGYRAPSFSWASMDGVIALIDPTEFEVTGTALLDILEISTRPKTNDETSILERAHLRVAGTLKQLQLQRVVRGDRREIHYTEHAFGPPINKAMNTVMIVNGKVLRAASQTEDWQMTLSTPSVHLDVDQDSFEGQTNLYCVNVFKDKSLYGLLLEGIPDLPGTFRRLGVYTIWWFDKPELMEIMLEHDENEEALQSESYDPVKRKHVFRLI